MNRSLPHFLAALGSKFKTFKNLSALVVILLLFSGKVNAQFSVTTNSGSGLAPTYTSLANAITALNAATITAPVVITCPTGTEAVPAAGYVITAQGTSVNTITIQGNGAANSIITGGSGVSTTTFFDAFFALRGADWVTIQGFAMTQSASTTVLEREIGVALLHASVTNGAQNNTIQNNTITLNKTNLNTWGIYSNNNHSATTSWATTEGVTNNTTGPASGNKVYNNIITNVNMGIAFIGTATTANQDIGNDIGGSAAGTGNTITNWGGAAAANSPISNSGTSYCIYLNHQVGENVSFNSLTSATISGTAVTLRGIYKDYSTGASIVGTTNINSNTITITDNFTSGTLECIRTQGTVVNTSTLNINNNTILNTSVGGASSSTTIVGIVNSEAVGTLSMNSNIVRGCTSTATTGGFTGVSNTGSVATSITMNNNAIGDASGNAITFSAATSGAVLGVNCSGGASTCATSVQTNDIRGIVHSVTGTSAMTLILVSGTPLTLNLSNNTLTNLTLNATGTTRLISYSYTAAANGTKTVNNNSIVTQLTRATSTGEFEALYDYGSTNVGSTITVTNNNFSNLTLPGASTTFYGFRLDDGGTGATHIVTGNTLSNWSTGSTSILGMIFANYFGTGTNSVSNNTISNITGTGSIIGILAAANGTAPTVLNINSNTVSGLVSSGTGGSVTGLTTSNTSASINIYKNKISDLSTTATTSLVAGLTISGSGTNLNVYNNLIGNLTASASNNTTIDAVRGINITSASTSSINLFYNTIYLAGTSSAANFASSGIFHTYSATATIASLLLKNNIIANTCTAKGVGKTSALRRSAATDLANFSTSSSNNLYYGSTLYFDGTNSDVTMAAFSTRVGARATASFTENPTFISTTASSVDFLHINTTTPTQIESGGTPISSPISITDDYDAVTRDVTTPDVGADEGTFTIAVPMSYTSSTTEQLTGSAYAGATNQSIIRVQIVTTGATSPLSLTSLTLNANGTTDIADINAATAKVYYTGASTTFVTSSLFGATTPTVANFTVTGSQALVEGNNYFWLAYDVASAATSANLIDGECIDLTVGTVQTPTVSAPSGNKSILGAMSGTYAVGASQTENGSAFTKLTTAIADLNLRGVSGAVIFALQSDYSSATETFPLTINAVTGASGANTITIKPAATVTATISGSVASGVLIKLNGADYVTIDGSNSGGTDRSLTITNTATTAPTAISLISLGTGLGATNNTIKNCNISTGVQTTTGYGIAIGGSTPGISGADNDNITIQNNNITNCAVGIYATGNGAVTTDGNDNLSITNNSVDYNSTLSSVFAIKVGNILTSNISNNTISLETTSTSVVGISLETGTNTTSVSKNKISKCKTTSAGSISYARGIVVGTASATSQITITNNVIYNVATAYGTSTVGGNAMGIMLGAIGTSTTYSTVVGGVDIYFNSVNLSGTYDRNTACTVDALFLGSAVSAINLKNNAFKNSTLNTNASASTSKSYAIYCQSANTAFTAIDYNDYYVSGSQGVLGFLGSDRVDLAGIQAGFGQNVNSIVTDPLFNSNTNLIPQPGSPVLGAGTAIGGITIDYLGTTRNNPPTIGAYDVATDEAGPVITYTALSSTCLTTNITLTATITDVSGVPTAGVLMPRIYYKKDAGAWFSSQGVLSSGTATNGTWTFTIVAADMGGVANPNVISYYVIAQDVAAISNITSNPSAGLVATDVNTVSTAPTTPNTYTIQNTLAAGTYTVGSGQTYATLTAAVAAYNTSCLGGAIVFSLMDVSYAGETFPITINANADASATNTLTIKPASGVTAAISGSSAVAIFKLNGADYVIIDGSNSGSTSKDLTITNTNTGTSSAVVWLGSASASNGATNNTIKNCIITGNAPTTTLVGIISSSGTTIGAAAQIANANNTYNNNTVNTAYYGIAVIGPTGNESGTVISGNLIGSATAGNKMGGIGILVNNQSGVSVTGNTIFGVTTSTDYTVSGIYVSGTQSGGTISGNNISDIKNTSSNLYDANGIFLGSSSTTASIDIYNNIIFDITGVGDATSSFLYYNGHGIVLYSGGGYNIYSNTVNMNTNQTGGLSSAIYITSSLVTAASVNIRNNIFANTQTAGANAGKRFAIYCAAANTIFGTINHNDYYSSGTHLGYIGSNRTTLAEVVTGFGGNANSISALPSFTSATDLHLTTSGNCSLNNAGTPISGITTDYDGENRSTTVPDIGADEFTGNINTAGVASATPTLCISTALTNITHTTTGATGIGSASGLPTGVSAAWASNTITISGTPSATGTFNYTIPLSGGTCSVNATGTITVNPKPTTLVLTGSLACAGTTGSITSSTSVSGVDYQLYDSANAAVGSVQAGTGSGLTWSSIAIGTGYYAKATNSTTSCVSSNSNNVAVGTITDKTWIGGTSTSWNTASNWSCGTLPSASDVIIISSGSPVLDTNFTVGSGGSLTISGTSTTFTISPTSTLTVTGTANFGGKAVTIKSNSSGNGAIGQVTGTLSGATNVTVERYIPAKRSWRAITAPVTMTTSINANWQEGSPGTGNGYGFDIWSNSGGTGIITGGTGSSLLAYDSTTNNTWSAITNTTTASSMMDGSKNKPFMAFVTGPYGTNNVTAGATETTLRATGTLLTGDKTYPTVANKYTFIGNPYASPLDLTAVLNNTSNATASFGGNVWVWDANVLGTYSVGTYNLFDFAASNYSYTSSNANISGAQIQSGQAFFVKSTDGANFSIKEAHKGSVFTNAVFRSGAPEILRVNLYKQVNNEWPGRDGAMTVVLSDADANQTPNKMANGTENIAFTKNGANFASNHHLPLVATDVLNVKVWNTTAGANYKLKINTEQFATTNLSATLEDLFTNARTPLTLDGSAVEYPFSVTTDALSTGDRFRIVFQTSTLGTTIPTATSFSIIPNPVTGDSFQVNLGTLATGSYSYFICNAIGQEVEKGSINNDTQNTSYTVKFRETAATGIYIMKIKGSDNSVFTAKLIKK